MKFVFKINSNYDGFTPRRLPQRRDEHGRIRLGWKRYIDAVEDGSEVWLYFRGSHAFTNGVYVKGVVDEIDADNDTVWLRPLALSADQPLVDDALNQRVAELVATRFRQVFVLPDALVPVSTCTLATTADSCERRECPTCQVWNSLPRVDLTTLRRPHRLPSTIEEYVPGYWSIPRRSFIHMGGRSPARGIRKTTEVFGEFKVGNAAIAYPLALAMAQQLADQDLGGFDAIVPIPLSPDKEQAGEIHRTKLLADELSKLLGVPARRWLTLTEPITKRRLRTVQGLSAAQFEARYRNTLSVNSAVSRAGRVLLVDDACTEGSTLASATRRIRAANPDVTIVATAAAQMVVRPAVANESALLDTATP